MRQTFAAAWALGLTTLAFPQAPETTTHDASALLREVLIEHWTHRQLPLHEAFSPEGSGATTATPADWDSWRVLDDDHLLSFLRAAAKDQPAEISIVSGHVMVKGPSAAQQSVAALLTYLSGALLQEFRVDVYALPPALGTTTGVVTAAECETLLAAKTPPVELGRTAVLLGHAARVRAGRGTSFVGGYEVEVANSAAIADPSVRVLQEGLDFHASVGLAEDGRLLVKFGCSRAALAEALATRAVGSTRLGDIQLPKVRSTLIVGSGFVEDGGGLVSRHDGGLGTGTLVRVRRVSPPPPASADHHVILADDLLARRVRVPIPEVRVPIRGARDAQQQTRDAAWTAACLEAETGLVPNEVVEGLVRGALGDDGRTSFEIVGTRVHVWGSDAKAGRVKETLAGFAKGLSRTVVVDFRIGKVDASPSSKKVDDLAASLRTGASTVSASSDQFLIAAGLEQAAITDQDVEIAEKSQIACPIVHPLFDGYVISGVASIPAADRIELALDIQQQEVLPLAGAGFALRAENVGPVDLPQINAAGGRYRLLVEPGQWTIVTSSSASDGATLVILARARWQ